MSQLYGIILTAGAPLFIGEGLEDAVHEKLGAEVPQRVGVFDVVASGSHLGDHIDCKAFPFNMSYESISIAPYRFGPRPDRPHVHLEYDEFALFLGADPDDLTELGADIETGMGKEMERHRMIQPTAIKLPQKFPHSPLNVNKIYQPFIFCIIRPYGVKGKTEL